MQQLQSINKPFLDQIVTCNEKWIVYDNQQQTTSVVGSRWSSKALPKAKLVPKKVVVTVWWSLVWSTIAFWISEKPLHLRSVLSKSMGCTKIAMTVAGIGEQKGPSSSPWQCLTAHYTTSTSKLEWIGLWNFASSTIFTWPLTNRLLLLQANW